MVNRKEKIQSLQAKKDELEQAIRNLDLEIGVLLDGTEEHVYGRIVATNSIPTNAMGMMGQVKSRIAIKQKYPSLNLPTNAMSKMAELKAGLL